MEDSIKLVFYNHFSGREHFEMQTGSRPWNMLLLLTEGSFSCRFGDQTFQIEKDEIAFFPQSTHFERAVISPISFHQFGFLSAENAPLARGCLPRAGKLSLPRPHVRALGETLNALSSPGSVDAGEQALTILRYVLLSHTLHEQRAQVAQSGQDGDVAWVIRRMTEHLAEPIRVESLARERHISRVGLLEKFKRHMGCSLSDFLIGLRMQRAKYLLLESPARINEIAALCGYRNAYYFSNAFKKHFGVSPLRYRRERIGIADEDQSSTEERPIASRSARDSI